MGYTGGECADRLQLLSVKQLDSHLIASIFRQLPVFDLLPQNLIHALDASIFLQGLQHVVNISSESPDLVTSAFQDSLGKIFGLADPNSSHLGAQVGQSSQHDSP